jgi:hypothetical protein
MEEGVFLGFIIRAIVNLLVVYLVFSLLEKGKSKNKVFLLSLLFGLIANILYGLIIELRNFSLSQEFFGTVIGIALAITVFYTTISHAIIRRFFKDKFIE